MIVFERKDFLYQHSITPHIFSQSQVSFAMLIQQTIITDAIGHGCNNFMQSEIAVAGFFGGDDTKNEMAGINHANYW